MRPDPIAVRQARFAKRSLIARAAQTVVSVDPDYYILPLPIRIGVIVAGALIGWAVPIALMTVSLR